MATEFTVTINLTGEDYSSVTTAEAGTQCDLTSAATKVFAHGGITGSLSDNDALTGKISGATGTLVHATSGQILIESIASGPFQSGEQVYETDCVNFVTLSDAGDSAIVVFECHKDDGDLDDAPTIAGATVDATNFRKFTVHVDDRHDGTENSGFRIHNTTVLPNGDCIAVSENNFVCEWIEGYRGGNNDVFFEVSATDVLLQNSLIYDCSEAAARLVGGGSLTVQNCAIYDCGTFGIYFVNGTGFSYNNLVFRCADGVEGGSSTNTVRNTAAMNSSGADFDNIGTESYNISSDATAGGTGSQTAKTSYSDYFTNVGAGTEDFSVKDASSVLYNAGTDLSGVGITTDIIGTARPQSTDYDVGPFEFIVAAGGSPSPRTHISGPMFGPLAGPIAFLICICVLCGVGGLRENVSR